MCNRFYQIENILASEPDTRFVDAWSKRANRLLKISNVEQGQVVGFGNDVQKVVSEVDTTFEKATGNSDTYYKNYFYIKLQTRVFRPDNSLKIPV